MSTIDQLGKGTILTEKVYNEEKIVDNYLHLDIFTGSFFTSIALSIICIVFLFKKNTEYLSWIFGLILIVITPLTWLSNFYISSNSPYKLYISICLFCGIILNFTAILMVIIYTTKLNQRIQDYKTNLIESPGKKISNIRINENIIDNYQKIKILFTTNIVLCITIILNFFVYEGEKTKIMEIKNANAQNAKNIETPMSKHIYWWHTIFKNFIKYIDDWIITWIQFVPIHGFLKMFLLFCIGFLFFFFSFFVKLKTIYQDSNISDPYVQNLIGAFGYGLKGVYPSNDFDIENFPDILVETAGPVNFAGLGAFFLAFTIWIIFSFIFNLIKYFIPEFVIKFNKGIKEQVDKINKNYSFMEYIIILLGKLIWLFLFFLFFLPLYFIALGKKNDQSSNNITSQNFILFVLCFVLALLGTPCIFMVFELLGRICNVSLADDIFQLFTKQINNCQTQNIFNLFKHYCNRSIITILLLLFSFFGITFGLYGYGGNFDGKDTGHWLSNNGNNSVIKLIIVIIMSLMVGWFFALHLKFNMFYFLYDCVMQPSRLALFTLAPIGVLALSITQVILADLTSKNIGNPIQTDG
jgi:hypothetical protein